MITIQNKKTGAIRDVSEDDLSAIQGRSRNWEVISRPKPKRAFAKKVEAEKPADAEIEE